MFNWSPGLLAFLIASTITAMELITTKYPSTFFVLTPRRSIIFYLYSGSYGVFAFILVAFPFLDLSKILGTSAPWIQAIIVGISIRAFLHIRLFSVQTGPPGTDPFPIGLESLVQIFEPYWLTIIQNDETDGLHRFLEPQVQKYQDKDEVKKLIMQNLRTDMPQEDFIAFREDVEDALQVLDRGGIFRAMQLYLVRMGKKNFQRVFCLHPRGIPNSIA